MTTIDVARLAGCSTSTVRRWATEASTYPLALRSHWIGGPTSAWYRRREYELAEVERWIEARRRREEMAEHLRKCRQMALAARRKRCCGRPGGTQDCGCRERRAKLKAIAEGRRQKALAAQPAEVRERWARRGWLRA